jgi:AbiTii
MRQIFQPNKYLDELIWISLMSDVHSIIKQIQTDILNQNTRLNDVLLKAKVLAYRLENDDFKKWVKSELDGYSGKDGLPDYRTVNIILRGTFSNGTWIHSNKVIPISNIPPSLREWADRAHFKQGVLSLEEMAKQEQFHSPLPGDWVNMYNIFNAESLSNGYYQLTEAHQPVPGVAVAQILGTIRSRLQDFILEIGNLTWDMDREAPPLDQVNRIFQITIINHPGEVNMSNLDQKSGDIYNVGQAGAVGKYASSNSNTFIQSEQKQTLAKAAEEIQKLLKCLERTNPSATQSEMISYINDETTPSLKRRTSGALKACGEAAIDEFLLENKYLKVIKATFKGWLQPDT